METNKDNPQQERLPELITRGNGNNNQEIPNELARYFAEVLDNICNTVRNKMVAPYTILKNIESANTQKALSKELVDISISDINWLCHNYLPEISGTIQNKSQQINLKQ